MIPNASTTKPTITAHLRIRPLGTFPENGEVQDQPSPRSFASSKRAFGIAFRSLFPTTTQVWTPNGLATKVAQGRFFLVHSNSENTCCFCKNFGSNIRQTLLFFTSAPQNMKDSLITIDAHSRILQHPDGIHDISGVVSLELISAPEGPSFRFEFLGGRLALKVSVPLESREADCLDEIVEDLSESVREMVLFSRSFVRFTDGRTLFTPVGQFDVPGLCGITVRHADTDRPVTCFHLADGGTVVAHNWRPTSDDHLALAFWIERQRPDAAETNLRVTVRESVPSSALNSKPRKTRMGSAQRRRRQARESKLRDDPRSHQISAPRESSYSPEQSHKRRRAHDEREMLRYDE
jgi:hypothetical protein